MLTAITVAGVVWMAVALIFVLSLVAAAHRKAIPSVDDSLAAKPPVPHHGRAPIQKPTTILPPTLPELEVVTESLAV
jgi:hypothetical protein